MTELLQRQVVRVEDVGEQVVLRVGSFNKSMHFVTALELAAMLRREARYAKASIGDRGFVRNCAGLLHDASAVRKASRRRAAALPEQLHVKQIRVTAKGQIVELKVGRTVMGIPYAAAASIAQWLRVHAKLARNTAGERAHWSELVSREVIEARA